MDPDINNLAQKMNFTLIPRPKGLSNIEGSLKQGNTRIKHISTSKVNGGSEYNLTVDSKQLVVHNVKSET